MWKHAQGEAAGAAGARRASVMSVYTRLKMLRHAQAEAAGADSARRASVVSVDTRTRS